QRPDRVQAVHAAAATAVAAAGGARHAAAIVDRALRADGYGFAGTDRDLAEARLLRRRATLHRAAGEVGPALEAARSALRVLGIEVVDDPGPVPEDVLAADQPTDPRAILALDTIADVVSLADVARDPAPSLAATGV